LINPTAYASQSGANPKGRRAKRVFARLTYPLLILIFGSFISFYIEGKADTFSVIPFVIVLLVTVVAAIYVALQTLNEYLIFSNTPTAKIDGAAYGLSEISANFVPENGAVMNLPIGGVKCIYYKIEFHEVVNEGKHSRDILLWSNQKGVPSLLSDGTGYLYGDYTTAEMGAYVNQYQIRDSKWFDTGERTKVIDALNASVNSQTGLDMRPFSNSITIDSSNSLNRAHIEYDSDTGGWFRSGGGYYLRVYYLPSEVPYFLMGNISDTGKSIDGKPLKVATIDPKSGIFSIVPKSKQDAMHKLKNNMIINFGLAVICLVLVLLIYNAGLIHL
jgi:fumarate reductase subunit D